MRCVGHDTRRSNDLVVNWKASGGVLTVVPNGLPSKLRKFVVVRNLGPTHCLGVYNNNVRCVERALVERYFMCKTTDGWKAPLIVRPRTFVNSEWLVDFRDRVVARCKYAPVMTIAQVVNAYTGPKRRLYQSAAESLMRSPLTARDARLTMFVKFEKQDLSKAPRVINPRSPRYNLVLGRRLKFLEKKVYRAINEVFGAHTCHTVIKGLNVLQSAKVMRNKWDRFKDPVAIGLDATKFDMHTSVEALKYEHSIYTGIFPHDKELRKILRWQLYNKGTAYCDDGKVKFRVKGTRCSGDLNTSLGNCVIMCSLVYARLRHCMVDGELCNNGDDCVVIMEREDLWRFMYRLEEWFTRYGYRMECEEPVYDFEQIEFCQSKPVWTVNGWCMVRNISACFKKDPMCLVPVQTTNVLRMWLRAVGDCGKAITTGVPVMQEWYSLFQRSGLECSEGFKEQIIKGTSALERSSGLAKMDYACVTAEARASFYFAFGMLPGIQIELEKTLQSMTIDCSIIEDLPHPDFAMDKYNNQCNLMIACCA